MIRPLSRPPRRHRPASSTTPRRPSRSLTGRVLESLEHRFVLTATTLPGTITLISPPTGFTLSSPTDGSIQGAGSSQTALAGQPTNFTALASFTVPGSVLDAGPFQADVTWGDGTGNDQATPESLGPGGPEIDGVGPIYGTAGADPNAQYTLRFDDSHTFAQPGTYPFTVTFLTGYAGTPAATATGTVTVTAQGSQGGAIVGNGYNLNATAGVSTLYYEMGTFQIPAADAGHSFTATINWGDGSPATWGGLSPGDGEDTFSGQHTYAAAGTYTYTVTLYEDGVAAGSASGTYNVSAAPSSGSVQGQGIDQTAVAGVDTRFNPLATFTVPAALYENGFGSVTIDWGDGSSASFQTFSSWNAQDGVPTETIAGEHTFASAGTYTYTASYTLGGTTLGTATGTVTVAAAGPITVTDPNPIDPIDTIYPGPVGVPIFYGPLSEFSLFGTVSSMPTFTPAVPPRNPFSMGQPIATTPVPIFTSPTPVSAAPPVSPLGAWIADFDVIYAELSTGLFAAPPSSPFTAAAVAPATGSTLMANPFQLDANTWDEGLALLAT